jgi:hypothetical protein
MPPTAECLHLNTVAVSGFVKDEALVIMCVFCQACERFIDLDDDNLALGYACRMDEGEESPIDSLGVG